MRSAIQEVSKIGNMMWHEIEEVVTLCEWYADRLFEGEQSFTQVTKWDDDDFRIVVWQGHGWGHDDQGEYRVAERIVFKKSVDTMMYVKMRKYPYKHIRNIMERKRLDCDLFS